MPAITHSTLYNHKTLLHQQPNSQKLHHIELNMKITRKPRKGAAVIAASMHGFASCRKFTSPVTVTLTLDRVKVKSTYTVYVGLLADPTT